MTSKLEADYAIARAEIMANAPEYAEVMKKKVLVADVIVAFGAMRLASMDNARASLVFLKAVEKGIIPAE